MKRQFRTTLMTMGFSAFLALQANSQSAPATSVVGMVVDAACFMMHPQAADSVRHDECGSACALAGVPLGVFDETSKQLYLADAKGSKLLLPHIHKRVRVNGQAVKKAEPLTLEMPVGQSNKMSVRVDGGYMALTVASVTAAP